MNWEEAFFKQYQDACTGRLVRGIVHNLNGVNQAFSLQSVLFKSFFSQAEELLSAAGSDFDDGARAKLLELVHKRAAMVEQMEEKLAVSANIVRRIQPIMASYADASFAGVPLPEIISVEDDYLCADPFFKHKTTREYDISPDLPLLVKTAGMVHTILFVLLSNAAEALRETEKPLVRVRAQVQESGLVVTVEDNGPGLSPDIASNAFEPFVTTKEGHLGVGLYVARKLARDLRGAVECDNSTGNGAVFSLALPLSSL